MPDDLDLGQIKFDNPNLSDPSPAKAPAKKAAAKKVASPFANKNTGRGPGRPTKSSEISDMAEEIIGFVSILAIPLKMRDIHEDGSSCADVFLNPDTMAPTPELGDFAYKFATVGVENKYIRKFFAMGDDVGKWVMLAQAGASLAMPIVAAHTKRFGDNNDVGARAVA